MIHKFITWWRNRRNYVVLDPRDSSITFSRRLFDRIKRLYGDADVSPKVFVFYEPSAQRYGFALNMSFEQLAQMADIQYNSKYKCIGFESLNPTVARMLYDYEVEDFMIPCRLTVTEHTTAQGWVYYQIERPYGKSSRNSTAC